MEFISDNLCIREVILYEVFVWVGEINHNILNILFLFNVTYALFKFCMRFFFDNFFDSFVSIINKDGGKFSCTSLLVLKKSMLIDANCFRPWIIHLLSTFNFELSVVAGVDELIAASISCSYFFQV